MNDPFVTIQVKLRQTMLDEAMDLFAGLGFEPDDPGEIVSRMAWAGLAELRREVQAGRIRSQPEQECPF